MNKLQLAATILGLAAEYIETFGWLQRDVGDHLGPRCAWGAIASAANTMCEYTRAGEDRNAVIDAEDLARNSLRNYLQDGIAHWNDRPGQTKENIVKKLRYFHSSPIALRLASERSIQEEE